MEELVREFLRTSLFGSYYNPKKDNYDPVDTAINRAYRDFCRTIRIDKEYNQRIKQKGIGACKDKASPIIKDAIAVVTTKEFEKWHTDLCSNLIKVGYSFGQAQKWINMTLKYLIVLDYPDVIKIQDKLHAPIDTDVIEKAIAENIVEEKKEYYIPWSTDNLNKSKYDKFQSQIKTKVKGMSRIEWEFQAWNDSSAKDE